MSPAPKPIRRPPDAVVWCERCQRWTRHGQPYVMISPGLFTHRLCPVPRMSGTDHTRPRRVHGHRVEVVQVRLFGGSRLHQARCSCGEVSEIMGRADVEVEKQRHLSLTSLVRS